MKRFPFLILALMTGLFFLTTQAFAGQPAGVEAKKTPGTPPGAQHTPGPHKTPRPTKFHARPQNYKGTIRAVDASSLTLTLGDGSSITVGITSETRIKIPASQSGTATLQVGMTAVVQALPDESGALVARHIVVVPGRPGLVHRVGWVTDYQAGVSITIQAQDGNAYTFQIGTETKILPAERAAQLGVGARVTVIAPRDPSTLGWTARGIVVHPAGSGQGSAPTSPTPTP